MPDTTSRIIGTNPRGQPAGLRHSRTARMIVNTSIPTLTIRSCVQTFVTQSSFTHRLSRSRIRDHPRSMPWSRTDGDDAHLRRGQNTLDGSDDVETVRLCGLAPEHDIDLVDVDDVMLRPLAAGRVAHRLKVAPRGPRR